MAWYSDIISLLAITLRGVSNKHCLLLFFIQIWVSSPHNATGYYTIYGDDSLHPDHFDAHLATGDTQTSYARTGYLGFVRRTELTQSDGGMVVIVDMIRTVLNIHLGRIFYISP